MWASEMGYKMFRCILDATAVWCSGEWKYPSTRQVLPRIMLRYSTHRKQFNTSRWTVWVWISLQLFACGTRLARLSPTFSDSVKLALLPSSYPLGACATLLFLLAAWTSSGFSSLRIAKFFSASQFQMLSAAKTKFISSSVRWFVCGGVSAKISFYSIYT